ncbi:MAG: TonB-dependent siderophore receptor, partial [Pseudomonadota bacterium]
MTTRFTRFALLASSALISTPALAQDNETKTNEDGDIIVSADVLYSSEINSVKTPTPIIDIPQSLSITTQEEI